jgi:hypothetical protein
MKKHAYTKILSIIFLTGIVLISGCDKNKTLTSGFLEGTISIGPICPVEKIPPDPACLPTAETYKAYPVSVFTSDGKNKIIQLKPSLDGSYISELPPGDYLVVLEKAQNNIGGSNLPVAISITSQDKTLLDVNIDTGIR